MTRGWRETVSCQRCGLNVSTEQPIKAWIRSHRDLDSKKQCLCIGDSDLWVQRYGIRKHQTGIDRSVMYLMLVEIKTHGDDLRGPQRDLLHVINQLLRTTPWKDQRVKGRFVPGHRQNARLVYSFIAGKSVRIHCYGVHKLRMSGATPDESEWITWDDKTVSTEQLLGLLRYDLNPDTLRRLEHRSHKRCSDMPELFGLAELIVGSVGGER